jgi:hypothetical protein
MVYVQLYDVYKCVMHDMYTHTSCGIACCMSMIDKQTDTLCIFDTCYATGIGFELC